MIEILEYLLVNYKNVKAKITELPRYLTMMGRNSPEEFYTKITLSREDLERMGLGTEIVIGGSDRRERLFRLSHDVWIHEQNTRGEVTVKFYVRR